MNSESDNIKNFLFVPGDENYSQDFYKLCLEGIKQDSTVLLITRKPFNLLPLLSKEQINKDQLKNFIIMHFERINDIVKKLLELHDWTLLPVLIIIDLNSFLRDYAWQLIETSTRKLSSLQPICLCIAALFNYMSSVEQRLLSSKAKATVHKVAHSIVLLGEHADIVSKAQLELLINLYFYDESAFDNYDEMKNEIVSTWHKKV